MIKNSSSLLITSLISLRLTLIPLFTFWLVSHGWERLPMMRDQNVYLADIEMISNDISSLLLSDSAYLSQNTLYSRICGLIGWFLNYLGIPPIFPAVLLNVVSQIMLSVIIVKIYRELGGKYDQLLFGFILFSPTISAYTLFALRDVFIAFCFSLFFLYMIRARLLNAGIVSLAFVFLRKFFFIFNITIMLTYVGLIRFQKVKHKVLTMASYVVGIGVVTYFIKEMPGTSWMFSKLFGTDPKKIFSSALGFARFVSDERTLVEAQEGVFARIMMFDSMILPIILVPVAYILLRRGTLKEKALALIVIITVMLLTVGYIILQGNFPMRKLLPVIPLMYILSFRAFEYLRENKKTILDMKLRSISPDERT